MDKDSALFVGLDLVTELDVIMDDGFVVFIISF
jgi:hypothetical protein